VTLLVTVVWQRPCYRRLIPVSWLEMLDTETGYGTAEYDNIDMILGL
jgi:hypothetical protein